MTKQKLIPNLVNRRGDARHFFASSVAEWRVDTDVVALITHFEREGYPFNVWHVPGTPDSHYRIENYVPQVDGAVWLVGYVPKKEA